MYLKVILTFITTFFLSTSVNAVCTSPAGKAGEIKLVNNHIRYCNDAGWMLTSYGAPSATACTKPGEIKYNATLQYCTGDTLVWQDMSGPTLSTCVGTTGSISYNTTFNRLEWCDAGTLKKVGGSGTVAINLGGGAVTADGWDFVSPATAGLTVTGANSFAGAITPTVVPTPTAGQRTLLEGVSHKLGAGTWSMSKAITNGNYSLYFYCIENYSNNFRRITISAEGATVVANVCELPAGHWVRLGPYPVTVSDGTLNIDVLTVANVDGLLNGVVIEPNY